MGDVPGIGCLACDGHPILNNQVVLSHEWDGWLE